jgi:Fe-S cluster assembly iron-binding protein IscA
MAKKIATQGRQGKDAYHNEYFDTGDLLLRGFMDRIDGTKLSEVKEGESEVNADGISRAELKMMSMDENRKTIEHIAVYAEDLKDCLISAYQDCSSDERAMKNIEKAIRKLEKIFAVMGIKYELFDPLKMMSGLKSGDILENAEKVITNTVKHYKMFGISSVKSFMNKKNPGIRIRLFGQNGISGFEVEATVTAKNDFNGNEAIDYVYSEDGGLMTIKARSAGTWVDVTEDYIVDLGTKRYKLGQADESLHSVFLGEKIISEGKEQILKVLNVSSENLTFGKCRAFSKDKKIIDGLTDLVRVNK